MKITFTLPPLSLALIADRDSRRRRNEEKLWQEEIERQWQEMGRPAFEAIRVTVTFPLPGEAGVSLVDCVASGSRLIADAIKGLLVSDVDPAHVEAWTFRWAMAGDACTTVVIEDTGMGPSLGRAMCSLYEECNAPLCPLDRCHLAGIWYPDEEVCRSRIHGNTPWIQAQRKLEKVEATGYFTVAMLNHLTVIRKGISGLDPNSLEHRQLRAWFQKRVEKTEAPPEERAARSRHLKKYAFKKRGGRKG